MKLLHCCVISKIYFVLRNLRLSSGFTPTEIRMKLAKQLIVPYVTYFANIYCKLDSSSLHKLNVALNLTTRYVYGLHRFEHVSSWSRKLLGCSLENFLNLNNCVFLHKLLKSKHPEYLYSKLCFCRHERTGRLLIPRYNYFNTTRLFFINTIRVWNSLPANLRAIEEENLFKQSITKYFSSKRN